jgi:lipopolysaccharide export LptBFGC system permease protein LptF
MYTDWKPGYSGFDCLLVARSFLHRFDTDFLRKKSKSVVKISTYFRIQSRVKKEWRNISTPLYRFTASPFLVLTLVLTNILRILGSWNPTVGDIYGF